MKNKEDQQEVNGSHDSPYGCPQSPDLSEFPALKIDSLPKDPLKKGEQYYIDLAGNIRKGPTNRISSCNCKPLFEKVERKMDSDKQEIKNHIDCRHDHLREKICHLEKKTTDMSETFKEQIACERSECMTRSLRNALKDKIEFERKQSIQVEQLKGHMKSWLDSKLKLQPQVPNPLPITAPNPAFNFLKIECPWCPPVPPKDLTPLPMLDSLQEKTRFLPSFNCNGSTNRTNHSPESGHQSASSSSLQASYTVHSNTVQQQPQQLSSSLV